jgi:hypothetical protein
VIKLNGFAERWFAGAGSLGFDGFDGGHPPIVKFWKAPFRATGILDPRRFTVITKTVTMAPRVGRQTNWGFHRYAMPLSLRKRSMVNAVALTNPGLMEWVRRYYLQAVHKGMRIVLSLHVENVEEARQMGFVCRLLPELAGVQINAGCPNLAAHGPTPPEQEVAEFRKIIDAFQEQYPGALLLKFRLGQPWEEMATDLDGRCAGYELINAVPWDIAFPADMAWHRPGGLAGLGQHQGPPISPFQKYGYGGSVSGGEIADASIRVLSTAKHRLKLKTPIISGGGVISYHRPNHFDHMKTTRWPNWVTLEFEAKNRLDMGADAIAFSTAFLWEPWGPNAVANKIDAERFAFKAAQTRSGDESDSRRSRATGIFAGG